ncbi:metallophosphoesterase [Bradyrhizobium sp. Arg62]|uniref:metallophosphoesterase family protein n=1 Tax=Bradyrhizobium brasilense TaxID=1419277 RepID=UPI001E458191|nr:metallophosphoesterase [Bradyrhizobium brasilense]MCC8951382.1 metallophosphoesterase [Bradyrhizobium brasilense]
MQPLILQLLDPSLLPRLRVLQVGDIHLPSSARSADSVDHKDARFPPDLKAMISSRPLKKAFEKIYEIASEEDISAILFMGDLTDYGSAAGYNACAAYISNSLQIGKTGLLKHLPVGVVSGNHDIDRLLAKSNPATAKFAPLNSALTSFGLPTIPVERPIWINLRKDDIVTSIALLNSCWGCGSPEFIPLEFRNDVNAAIDNAIAKGTSGREVQAYYERQFDTPAFSSESIQQLLADIDTNPSSLFLVTAHHNILPQRMPRLAPYTELVNSGALRSVLQELGKPVVYLHGHIHQDPIEIVSIPNGLPLLSVSAPLITAGFNVLEFVFTRGGMPLSCRILKWRFDEAGYIRRVEPITVSLIGLRRRSQRPSLIEVYKIVLDAKEIYWSDLVSRCSQLYLSMPDDLEEDLELLATDHRVTIENYGMSHPNWIVKASI